MADENKKPIIPTLTRANYHAWLAAVKDELYAIQADELLNKSELDAHGAELLMVMYAGKLTSC